MSTTTHQINDENILASIKKLVMVDESYTVFDEDIRIHINTVLSNLCQMGIGPVDGFSVLTGEEVWSDFINDNKKLQNVKTYVYLKVRLVFDPPQNSTLVESINSQIKELEYRMYTETGGY